MTQDEGMRIVQVSIGIRHALVLRANGTVLAWGDNIGGICEVPDGLTDVFRIVAGDYHSLVIRSDGTVVSWGGNGFFEFGENEVAPNGVPKGLTM